MESFRFGSLRFGSVRFYRQHGSPNVCQPNYLMWCLRKQQWLRNICIRADVNTKSTDFILKLVSKLIWLFERNWKYGTTRNIHTGVKSISNGIAFRWKIHFKLKINVLQKHISKFGASTILAIRYTCEHRSERMENSLYLCKILSAKLWSVVIDVVHKLLWKIASTRFMTNLKHFHGIFCSYFCCIFRFSACIFGSIWNGSTQRCAKANENSKWKKPF